MKSNKLTILIAILLLLSHIMAVTLYYTKDKPAIDDSILNMEYSPAFVSKVYDMWEDQTDEWKKNVGYIMIENGMAYMDESMARYFGIWDGYEEADHNE